MVSGRRGISTGQHRTTLMDLHECADTADHCIFFALQVRDGLADSMATAMALPRVQRTAIDGVNGKMSIKYAIERDPCPEKLHERVLATWDVYAGWASPADVCVHASHLGIAELETVELDQRPRVVGFGSREADKDLSQALLLYSRKDSCLQQISLKSAGRLRGLGRSFTTRASTKWCRRWFQEARR